MQKLLQTFSRDRRCGVALLLGLPNVQMEPESVAAPAVLACTPPKKYTFTEPDDDSNIIFDAEGTISAATFEKLVERLTHPDNYPGPEFANEFMLNYRSFSTPTDLMEALLSRFNSATEPHERATRIRLRAFSIFRMWISRYSDDFVECLDEIRPLCQEFIACARADPALARVAEASEIQLQRTVEMVGLARVIIKPLPEPLWNPEGLDFNTFKWIDVSIEELARQICLRDFSLYKAIRPREMLGQGWVKRNKHLISPNILAAIASFGKMSNWVCSDILMRDSAQDQATAVTKFIELSHTLMFEMNNFSSSLAIAAGLQTVAIARLNITWSAINNTAKEKLDKINHVASRDKNFNALRHALREVNPPCVPYLGMFLTDLTFIEEGGSDWSHSNLIRWKKCKRVSSVLREMLVYQSCNYDFAPVPFLQDWLERPH